MLYITGDTHGDQNKWMAEIHPILQPGDTIIIAGDFGVGFWNGPQGSEEQFFDWLQNQPYTVLFCDGNHCNFEKLEKYPVEGWNGGRVHVLRSNLLHLMRGELYTIGQKSVFAFGGGYSLDKYRRVEGVSWWPQEMPSAQEYENAKRNLKQHENRVDIIVTHTAPAASSANTSERSASAGRQRLLSVYAVSVRHQGQCGRGIPAHGVPRPDLRQRLV